jgi:hypothetical protein
MKLKRAVFMAVLVVAIAALAVPLLGLRAAAAGSAAPSKRAATAPKATAASGSTANAAVQQNQVAEVVQGDTGQSGRISADTLKALGITKAKNPSETSAKIGAMLRNKHNKANGGANGGDVSIQSGNPLVLDARSALSDALIIALGGRDNQFSEVALIADWDGREDCTVDREQKVDDFSFAESEIDVELTHTAISEHTVANGFNDNVYYYGDSVGNLWVGNDTNPGLPGGTAVGGALGSGGVPGNTFGPQVDVISQLNIVQLVNAGFTGTGSPVGQVNLIKPGGALVGGSAVSGDCLDDQVDVTGIAVNPVADLGDFSPALCGTIGEVVYVSVLDTEGCTKNASNQPLRTRIFVFGFLDNVGVPGLTSVGAIQILRSRFSDIAGVAVDDDGSLYYQLADLIQLTGAALFKATEVCRPVNCANGAATGGSEVAAALAPANRINRVITGIPDPPTLNSWINNTSAPPTGAVIFSGARHTNYGGGSSTLFGDIIAIATGPCNVLYAAVSRSFVAGGVSFDQLTEGLFPAPSPFGAAGTPSMVISFADCSGAFDTCSGNALIPVLADPNVGNILPEADGFADKANSSVTTLIPGVNNFRIFVEGNGPDLRPAVGGTALVPGTLPGDLKVDMQIDYVPAHSGITVSGEGTVFVISGGAPAGVGKSPSPMVGEILCFEDICPSDRRADFVDLRGDQVPNPPASGGNVGDGDSDRFDHIFYQAPLDQNTLTVAGLTGLARGFLRYTNRLAPNPISPGVTVGQIGGPTVLPDNSTAGAIIFEWLDPGHQVAGGDDQNVPNRGDDSDTVPGTTAISSPPIGVIPNSSAPGENLNGGFEFTFNGFLPGGAPNCVWNGFYWNSNGNITFGTGDTSPLVSVPAFRQGLPKIAPAWAKLDPDARSENLCAFPVMALGFVNVNAFKIRWINVPEEGSEGCTGTNLTPGNSSNTFSVTLYDDGTGVDENTTETLSPVAAVGNNVNDGAVTFDKQEGPTDLRFTPVTLAGGAGTVLVGCNPRPEGSGIFVFEYCRMDLLGTATRPVLTGFSVGGLNPLNNPPPGVNPPGVLAGICGVNLSLAQGEALTAFGVLATTNNETAAIGCNCCIGEGTEPTLFELFNCGSDASIGAQGEVTFAKPCFDLRFEGNDAALCTALRQKDSNRGKLCFFGIGCSVPSAVTCAAVIPGVFVTTPTTVGVINAVCQVTLNLVGCGFFPNEVTTVCQGFADDTGIPLQRPGKTVTTAATLQCDTNGDGIPDSTVFVLGNVTPVNCNLVTAQVGPDTHEIGEAFPTFCCGGVATVTVTTTFTPGDNNLFGLQTRVSKCTINLGVRAPVIFSVTPSAGDCSLCQDLLVSGACFCGPDGTFNVTSVILQDVANPANKITVGVGPSAGNPTGSIIKPLTCNLFDVFVCFTSANAGKTFLFFAVGPGGTSRNLTAPVTGQPGAPCPLLGNEQGIQVTFKCNNPGTGNPPGGPTAQIATVTNCHLDRQDTGQFFLDVTGTGIKDGATATVGGVTPKKIKVISVETGTTNPTVLRLIKKVCNGLPGNVIITNTVPGGGPSQPFLCTERCPAN